MNNKIYKIFNQIRNLIFSQLKNQCIINDRNKIRFEIREPLWQQIDNQLIKNQREDYE